MNEIIIAAIGAIVTMVTALITARNIKSKTTTTTTAEVTEKITKQKDKEWKDAYKPQKVQEGVVKNTTLMIGLGRVGKTQLLKTITENNPDSQHIENITDDFTIENYTVTNNGQKQINHYITDYRGQNFSQLIASFIQEQLEPNTPLRYGDINTLLLISVHP